MSPPLFIALRFIRHRQRSILISLAGITLGVAFFICTQAQTQGFEQFYIQTVLGTSGAVLVQDRFQDRYTGILEQKTNDMLSVSGQKPRKYYDGVNDPDRMMRAIREFSNVRACAPVLEDNASILTDFRSEVCRVLGIDLEAQLAATDLRAHLIEGDLGTFRTTPSGVLLVSLLALKMNSKVGDNISLIAAGGETRSFRVCGISQTGDNLIDERRAYIHLRVAQSLLSKPAAVSYIIVKMSDPDRAPQLAKRLEELLRHRARSWQERAQGNLQIFRAIRISAAITVSAIIMLAGFGIFNVLTLMIIDKVREIAILRSMGYQRRDISAIFLWQGLLVAATGSVLGCALGFGMTFFVSRVPMHIRGFFAADHFMVHWSGLHYVMAVVIAFVAVLLASYFPSRRAARLAPVAILRGSGQ
ncbi:MAG: transporter permease [Pedosphaera sp.]|nr:transporter permease [Pedosphaera sp.]